MCVLVNECLTYIQTVSDLVHGLVYSGLMWAAAIFLTSTIYFFNIFPQNHKSSEHRLSKSSLLKISCLFSVDQSKPICLEMLLVNKSENRGKIRKEMSHTSYHQLSEAVVLSKVYVTIHCRGFGCKLWSSTLVVGNTNNVMAVMGSLHVLQ